MTENNDEDLTVEAVLNKNIFNGYSDYELELLVDPPDVDRGIAPWVYWTSELYSFGRLYREWAYYPRFLPLFIYSDHGVHKIPSLASHELDNDATIHFAFNQERALKNLTVTQKKVICVPHPWVTYRRRKNITQSKDAKGTLIYFSHSCDGMELTEHDSDEYFEKLKNLPEKYKPLVLCMHMHDINKGYHKDLRKYGIPIVTAGKTSSVKFVDRFYNMIKGFKYATSNVAGSQLYYCTEMGIPYFLLGGKKIKFENYSNPSMPLGGITALDPVQVETVRIENELFRQQKDTVNTKQKIYVDNMLGINSGVTRLQASWMIWGEFFRNWKKWYIIIRPTVAYLLRKVGLLKIVKNLIK